MKAITYSKYGGPEVLELKEVPQPVPKDNELLIKVHASTVTAVDCTFRKGSPLIGRLFTGLFKPKHPIPGTEFAGEVCEVGKEVTNFNAGDRLFGTTTGFGAHGEYLCLPSDASTLATMPDSLTYDEAACCDGFLTAIPFLRDTGRIEKGQEVLIIGASGSVGSAAVQMARHFGAVVSGVCSTANVELVKSLGAQTVFDYSREDFTRSGRTYDIIFDAVGKSSFSRCKQSLKRDGVFMETTLTSTILPQILWTALFGRKKAKMAFTGLRSPAERTKDLILTRDLIKAGVIKPVIDRVCPLEQLGEAHRYVETGHKRGNVVIVVNSN